MNSSRKVDESWKTRVCVIDRREFPRSETRRPNSFLGPPPLVPLRFRIAKENAEPAGADLKNAADPPPSVTAYHGFSSFTVLESD